MNSQQPPAEQYAEKFAPENHVPRTGCEFEFPLLPEDPHIFRLNQESFWNDLNTALGEDWTIDRDARSHGILGMSSNKPDRTVFSYDASILLLELSLPPHVTLESLSDQLKQELKIVIDICRKHAIRVLGFGMQPELDIHEADAKKLWRTPKDIYPILDARQWDHQQNLNIASIQPNIDIPIRGAIAYINMLEKTLPLLEPLLANACIEQWKADLNIAERRNFLSWSKMLARSIDRPFATVGMPKEPYPDLTAYLQFLYSNPLFFVMVGKGDYKHAEKIFPDNIPAEARPPSLLELMEAKKWNGKTVEGEAREIDMDELQPAPTASLDFMNFRPARLRFRIDPTTCPDWKTFKEVMTNDPESLFTRTFVEVRSIATQLPGEEMLPATIVTGMVRAKDELEEYLRAFEWNEVFDFSRNRSYRFDAWGANIGGRPYAEVAGEIVAIIRKHLSDAERSYLQNGFEQRLQQGVSPSFIAREAFAESKDNFLKLTVHSSKISS